MQIFLPYKDVYASAKLMKEVDPRRFNKQIIECRQILHAIEGLNKGEKRPWYHHPIVLMYKDHAEFLKYYLSVFEIVKYNLSTDDKELSDKYVDLITSDFFKDAEWYFDNFKRRLFTKDQTKYDIFKDYGESHSNFYHINGEWKEYKS